MCSTVYLVIISKDSFIDIKYFTMMEVLLWNKFPKQFSKFFHRILNNDKFFAFHSKHHDCLSVHSISLMNPWNCLQFKGDQNSGRYSHWSLFIEPLQYVSLLTHHTLIFQLIFNVLSYHRNKILKKPKGSFFFFFYVTENLFASTKLYSNLMKLGIGTDNA